MIIGLIGQKRVGKDTVAIILKDLNSNFKSMALAEPIKQIARIMFNFTEEQLYDDAKDIIDEKWGIKPRDFFERFGTEIMQYDIYNYLPNLKNKVPERLFWVKSLLSKIDSNDDIIITDVRGLHELLEIKKHNAIFIKIIRKLEINNENMHITQKEAGEIPDEYIFDTIINDGSLDDLREKVVKIWGKIN